MQILFAGLLLLSATVLSQDENVTRRYRNFISRHVGKVSHTRCTSEMTRRGLTKSSDGNECKEINMFIDADKSRINDICKSAGERLGTFTKSLQPFNIVVCNLTNNKRYPRCEYRGQTDNRYLVLQCEQGLPVHFEKAIPAIPGFE